MATGLPYGYLTEAVIGAAFEVHGALGYGFGRRKVEFKRLVWNLKG
jgi:hypothetical protein